MCRSGTRDVGISPVGTAFHSALAFAKRSGLTCWHRSSERWDAKLEACKAADRSSACGTKSLVRLELGCLATADVRKSWEPVKWICPSDAKRLNLGTVPNRLIR